MGTNLGPFAVSVWYYYDWIHFASYVFEKGKKIVKLPMTRIYNSLYWQERIHSGYDQNCSPRVTQSECQAHFAVKF